MTAACPDMDAVSAMALATLERATRAEAECERLRQAARLDENDWKSRALHAEAQVRHAADMATLSALEESVAAVECRLLRAECARWRRRLAHVDTRANVMTSRVHAQRFELTLLNAVARGEKDSRLKRYQRALAEVERLRTARAADLARMADPEGVVAMVAAMPWEKRRELFELLRSNRSWCRECGSDDPRCQCWNDE